MSETNTGTIVGFLRLDAAQWHEAIDRAEAAARRLGTVDPDVHVDTNAGKAAVELETAHRAAERLDGSTKNLDTSNRQAAGSARLLVTAVAALGPALVPMTGAALAGAAAFGGLGLAGVLAAVSIKQQMKAGTEQGLQFSAAVDMLKTNVLDLGASAASGVLGPFQKMVTDLNARTPALSGQVNIMARMLGNSLAPTVAGLLTLFQRFAPLMESVGAKIAAGGRAFEAWSGSVNVTGFIAYMNSSLGPVTGMLSDLVQAVVHLAVAFAPLGGATVSILTILSQAISAIPTPVLQALVTLGSTVFTTFKLWSGISGMIESLSGALVRMGASAASTAGAMRALSLAGGALSVALGAAALIFSMMSSEAAETKRKIDDLTRAFIESQGAITDQIAQQRALELSQQGMKDAAEKAGVSFRDVTLASLGQADALARVKEQLDANIAATDGSYFAVEAQRKATTGLLGVIKQQSDLTAQAKIGQEEHAAATKVTTDATIAQQNALQQEAQRLGTTTTALQAAKDAQAKVADKAAAATVQMQLEGNAAGLLKAQLDALNGVALGVAESQNAFNQALLSGGAQMKKNKGSLKEMTEAGEANRSSLIQQINTANASAEAVANQTNSTEAGRKKLLEMREEIIKNAVANGANAKEVRNFIDNLLKVPKSIPPTKVEADTAAAKAALEALTKRRAVQVDVILNRPSATGRSLIDGIMRNADGNILGPVVRHYAGGGTESHVAQIAPAGAWRVWAEPETGGEAYIPLAPSKRSRSVQILAETNRLMGNPLGGGSVDIDGARITGSVRIVDGGLMEFVDARIETAITSEARAYRRGVR